MYHLGMAFVKLHGEILNSSIWLEDQPTRLLWITMLAMADQDGVVQASVGGLAHRARISREECEHGLSILTSPDPDSRDGTTGERVEKVPGGWFILNHANYRDRQTDAQARTAARVARHRAGKKAKTVTGNEEGLGNDLSPSEAEAEADTEAHSSSSSSGTVPVDPCPEPLKRTHQEVNDLINRVTDKVRLRRTGR